MRKCQWCGKEYTREEGVTITTSDGHDWEIEMVHKSSYCEVKNRIEERE